MIIIAKRINGIISLIDSQNQQKSSKKYVFLNHFLLNRSIITLDEIHINLDLAIFGHYLT